MSLKRLLSQDRVRRHKTSKEEISNLLRLVERDLKDAKVKGLSRDRRFATAYNAVLQSATIVLYCRGYKPKGTGHHMTVFESMKDILGEDYHELADYFDSCRAKRNITDYTLAGEISEADADELIGEAEDFFETVRQWLKKNYPRLSTDS